MLTGARGGATSAAPTTVAPKSSATVPITVASAKSRGSPLKACKSSAAPTVAVMAENFVVVVVFMPLPTERAPDYFIGRSERLPARNRRR